MEDAKTTQATDYAAEFARDFFEAGIVKFGSFTLKSGMQSPIYLDLRRLISKPKLLKKVAAALCKKARADKIRYKRLAGIPYAGIPIAVAMSLKNSKPCLFARKEVKDYGTKQAVEGEFKEKEKVLVVDDLITTGASKIEAVAPLTACGLKVHDFIVIVDREQGGKEELEAKGYALHSLLKITDLLAELKKQGLVDEAKYAETIAFINNNKVQVKPA